jgi:hypothetical protein
MQSFEKTCDGMQSLVSVAQESSEEAVSSVMQFVDRNGTWREERQHIESKLLEAIDTNMKALKGGIDTILTSFHGSLDDHKKNVCITY